MAQSTTVSFQAVAHKVFAHVADAGAEADLIVDQGQSLSLKANQGALEEHKVSSTQIFGVRLIKDQRVGTAYSETSDDNALALMVKQALTNAVFASPEPTEMIIRNAYRLSTDDAVLCPEDSSSVEQKILLALQLEQSLVAKPKIKNVPYNYVYDCTYERHLFSSRGFHGRARERRVMAYAVALAEERDLNAMDWGGQLARRFTEIDGEVIIRDAYEKSTDLLYGKPMPTGHYDVIFDEECQADLFTAFLMALSGKTAKDGLSPWREQVGKQVADSRVHLFDSPLRDDGFGYTLFDAEGMACREIPLIVEGYLQTLAHNSVTARHFGVGTTGHASRGPKSGLGVSLHQLTMAPGRDSEASLKGGRYLEITELAGLHSGASAISGDFSFRASGHLCREGQRVQPVRGITVASNFYKMLKRIVAIGDTQQWNLHKSMCLPAIRFANMAISGD